jgi:uncharacterized coiled-coil DUF342 family protein
LFHTEGQNLIAEIILMKTNILELNAFRKIHADERANYLAGYSEKSKELNDKIAESNNQCQQLKKDLKRLRSEWDNQPRNG